MTAAALRRNRDFMLLQFAELLSSGGSQMTAITYPLRSLPRLAAVFAAFGLVLALWGTLSSAISAAPSLQEFAEPQAPA